MGKQAKKKEKSDVQSNNQRRHNSSTRGINGKKRGPLWAIRSFKTKNEDGKEVTETYEVRVPYRARWNPFDKSRFLPGAQEPFDALQLDWRVEINHFMANKNARIGSITLEDGTYLHRVYKGDSVQNPDEILLEVQSASKLVRGRKRSRRK